MTSVRENYESLEKFYRVKNVVGVRLTEGMDRDVLMNVLGSELNPSNRLEYRESVLKAVERTMVALLKMDQRKIDLKYVELLMDAVYEASNLDPTYRKSSGMYSHMEKSMLGYVNMGIVSSLVEIRNAWGEQSCDVEDPLSCYVSELKKGLTHQRVARESDFVKSWEYVETLETLFGCAEYRSSVVRNYVWNTCRKLVSVLSKEGFYSEYENDLVTGYLNWIKNVVVMNKRLENVYDGSDTRLYVSYYTDHAEEYENERSRVVRELEKRTFDVLEHLSAVKTVW